MQTRKNAAACGRLVFSQQSATPVKKIPNEVLVGVAVVMSILAVVTSKKMDVPTVTSQVVARPAAVTVPSSQPKVGVKEESSTVEYGSGLMTGPPDGAPVAVARISPDPNSGPGLLTSSPYLQSSAAAPVSYAVPEAATFITGGEKP